MKQYFAIMISDQVSRCGAQFSISALEDIIWQASVGGRPCNMSHDLHRLIGWSYVKGLYFDYQKTFIVGCILAAENDHEFRHIHKARRAFLTNTMNKEIQPHRRNFINELECAFDETKGSLFYNNLVLYKRENILCTVFPKLGSSINSDKDYLVEISVLLDDFEYLGHGVFKDKCFAKAVLAHSFFRKSLSHYNNFHSMFLDELVRLSKTGKVKTKIKLDPDLIGFSPSFRHSFEFEYWWGPKYNDDIASIRPGLTKHVSGKSEKIYSNIDETAFFWKVNNELHEFELEEITSEPSPTLTDTYACRYLHSIYNKEKQEFQHFDGAIRSYSTKLMEERRASKMTEFGRRSVYTKLFRVDGKLSLGSWKSLVTNYLQGNPQIYEYFNLPKPSVEQIQDEKDKGSPLEKYIPYSVSRKDGVRLFVSYHAKKNHGNRKRYVSIPDTVHMKDSKYNAVEFFTVEVKKALNRLGEDLELPEECKYTFPGDYYINIPCIYHSAEKTQQILDKTIEALKLITNSLCKRNSEEVISFTLAWDIEDKEVRISGVGHVEDLNKWFTSYTSIPAERKALKKWLEQQQKYSLSNGKTTTTPVLSEIIQEDGVLYFKRRSIQLDVNLKATKGGELNFEVDDSKQDLIEQISKKHIFISPSMVIEKVICSKSGMNYFESPHSITLDDDVSSSVKKAQLAGFHWTDKPLVP